MIPKAAGPYSAAVRAGNTVYTSGQLPVDAVTGEIISTSPADALRVIFVNIAEILKVEGMTCDDIVKVNVFTSRMEYFAEFNEYYATLFSAPFPARTFVQAAALPKNVMFEIDVIAVKD